MAGGVSVVFIGGTGRSGSTLMSRILGAVPGFCAVGELCRIWDHGVRRDEKCACGVPFHECDFWRRMGDTAFGGWDRVDLGSVLGTQRRLVRTRYLPALAAPAPVPGFGPRLRAYAGSWACSTARSAR
ncbi:hypothetical protein MPTA5024_24315 [Microbispora sp. ATCC PTA-5024]|nr:hypothetical protein MPTA5024_24315 [Microbispora sp. ATCC PTA-5024]